MKPVSPILVIREGWSAADCGGFCAADFSRIYWVQDLQEAHHWVLQHAAHPACILVRADLPGLAAWLRHCMAFNPDAHCIGLEGSPMGPEALQALFNAGMVDLRPLPLSEAQLSACLKLWGFKRKKPPFSWWQRLKMRLTRTPSLAFTPYSLAAEGTSPVISGPLEPPAEAFDLEVCYLGSQKLVVQGKEVVLDLARKPRTVLAYLLIHGQRRIPCGRLMDTFWEHASPASAKNSLQNAISTIRKTLRPWLAGEELILFDRDSYRLNPKLSTQVDVLRFRHALASGRQVESLQGMAAAQPLYREAANLYQGDFFHEDPYEPWIESEHASLREAYLFVLDKISHYHSNNGTPFEALQICHKILQIDNCREDIHRRMMRCYFRLGHRRQAVQQFVKCQEILQREFGGAPTPETLDLYEKIRSQGLPDEEFPLA